MTSTIRPQVSADPSFTDLRWAIYLRMLSQRWRANEAATGNAVWYSNFDDDEFDMMTAALEGRLASPFLSTLDHATCSAALTVVDVARAELRERESAA